MLLPEQPGQLEAVAARQQHIENREIGRDGQYIARPGEILEPGGGEPFSAERREYRIADRLLVLDHHHSTDWLAHRVSDCPELCLKIG